MPRGSDCLTDGRDTMDTREVLDRIAYLERNLPDELEEGDEEDRAELAALRRFVDELDGYGDLACGETLIRDSCFPTFAREYARDVADFKDDGRWPHSCIDWDRAAEELQRDYTSAELDGVTYWMRC